MQLEITLYDACGSVLTHDIVEASVATEAEIADMIAMIEVGTPAYIAAILAKQHQPI